MAQVTGVMVIDAPASALNNAGSVKDSRTDNVVVVKAIRVPEGRLPYVSAQALRYWLRTELAQTKGWTASPVFREEKVAYSDAEPTKYAEDDLFGYMRAASKGTDEKTAAKRAEVNAKATSVEKGVTLTRVSPFKVGTAVSTVPVHITRDWGVMARSGGDPVPFEHEFYRAHLLAPWALDLEAVGTFFDSKQTGFCNLDKDRLEAAKKEGATDVIVRGQKAVRMPVAVRAKRSAMLLRALGTLDGGAKHTLHLTDTAPALCVFAVLAHGNQVFQRVVGTRDGEHTAFRTEVLDEVLAVHAEALQSPIYVGWSAGFLEDERRRFDEWHAKLDESMRGRIVVGHPRALFDAVAKDLEDGKNAAWFE